MDWFTSWFSFGTKQRIRHGQILSSITHEAFSLPTSSPVLAAHPDAFNPDTLGTPEPESSATPSYTYPPIREEAYSYVPTSAGLGSRQSSLLPLHYDRSHSLFPTSDYPPLSRTWDRIRAWLSREYPELGDTLNYGILPQDLEQIEMQFGFPLPPAIRESYLCVDGQEPESSAGCSEGLFFGLTMLSLEDVLEEWRFWREVDDDPTTGANPRLQESMQSYPPGWIRREYSQRGWIPLITDKAGNYVGIDLSPDEGGSAGQVIIFGRDFDTKVVLWRGDGAGGWASWLASFAEELESGEGFEIGASNDASDGSEDGVGYDSYFQDGNGRGQGEGGGESGHGGLRLAGDYRGWSTLEAWADRSLRRWYEAGAIPDQPIEPDTKKTDNIGLGVLHIDPQASSTVVATNATSDPDGSTIAQSPPIIQVSASSSRQHISTVSISKPPAPLPVDLPTPYDILPPSSQTSLEEDLESGNSLNMREISRGEDAVLVSARNSPRPTIVSEVRPSRSPAPSRSSPAPLAESSDLVDASTPEPKPQVQDLFADPDPVLETTPIEPTSPLTPKSTETIIADREALAEQYHAVPTSPEPDIPNAGEPEADVTVRLVGNGGISGSSNAPQEASGVDSEAERSSTDSSSQATVTSPMSPEPVARKDGRKHDRKMSSLTSLKKLGNLGSLLRKDSSSNIKEAN